MERKIFSPMNIRGVNLRNRIFVSPMCQYSSIDGIPNDWHFVHLGSRAVGGASLVIAEATAVSAEGRISPSDTGIWNDDQVSAFKRIAAFIESQGAVPGIQLAHAGRKASTAVPWKDRHPVPISDGGWQTIAPSPIPFEAGNPVPHELSIEEIDSLINKFADATRRALLAGFKVIEIHMAHGYLLHEFLSPICNHRHDQYGGSLEKRMKMPLKVAEIVRRTWPESLPLFVRISATDWVENGWDLAQSITFSRKLKDVGVDLIDCSSGGLVPNAEIPAGPGFQVPFSAAIRREVEIATAAVGLIVDPQQAEQILVCGEADAVVLARAMLRNPYWPLTAAHELGADIKWPIQYERAKR